MVVGSPALKTRARKGWRGWVRGRGPGPGTHGPTMGSMTSWGRTAPILDSITNNQTGPWLCTCSENLGEEPGVWAASRCSRNTSRSQA
jgi:hypothetical protein